MKFRANCQWEVVKGYRHFGSPAFWTDFRTEMLNKTVVAAVTIQEPFQYPCVLTNVYTCNRLGINFDIFKALMSFIGLNFSIVPAESDSTGFQDANGSWHGVLGQIVRHEINMTAYLISVKPERLKIADFSQAVSYYSKAFLIHRPGSRDLTAVPSFLASPLYPITWLLLFASLLTVFLGKILVKIPL